MSTLNYSTTLLLAVVSLSFSYAQTNEDLEKKIKV